MAISPPPSGSAGPGTSCAPRSRAVRTADPLSCGEAVEARSCTDPALALPRPCAAGAAFAGPTSTTARAAATTAPRQIRGSAVREVPEVMVAHLRIQHGLGRAGREEPEPDAVPPRGAARCPPQAWQPDRKGGRLEA